MRFQVKFLLLKRRRVEYRTEKRNRHGGKNLERKNEKLKIGLTPNSHFRVVKTKQQQKRMANKKDKWDVGLFSILFYFLSSCA